MEYIMVMRHDRFWLVGPFGSNDDAGTWGRANNPHDDPRWQTIMLAEVPAGVRLVSPYAGPMEK